MFNPLLDVSFVYISITNLTDSAGTALRQNIYVVDLSASNKFQHKQSQYVFVKIYVMAISQAEQIVPLGTNYLLNRKLFIF